MSKYDEEMFNEYVKRYHNRPMTPIKTEKPKRGFFSKAFDYVKIPVNRLLSDAGMVQSDIAGFLGLQDISDDIKKNAELDPRYHYQGNRYSMDYLKDPRGLIGDVGGVLGSGVPMILAGMLTGGAVPAGYLATGAGKAGQALNALGKTKLIGAPITKAATKLISSEGGNIARNALSGLVSGGVESAAEGGGAKRTVLEKGGSKQEARNAALKTFGGNMLMTPFINAAELKFIDGLTNGMKQGAKKELVDILKTMGMQGFEEGMQQNISNAATGEDGFWHVSPDELESAYVGAITAGALGGTGKVGARFVNGKSQSKQTKQANQVNTKQLSEMKLLQEAIGNVESRGSGGYKAKNPSGAFGRYQFMPETYTGIAKKLGFDPRDDSPATQDKAFFAHANNLYQKGGAEAVIRGWNPNGGDAYFQKVQKEMKRLQQQGIDSQQKHYVVNKEVSNPNLNQLTETKLNELARRYKEAWGESLNVTSMSRKGAKGASWHNSGQAFDVVGGKLANDPKVRRWMEEQAKDLKLSPLDEYENPSTNATGGHMHFSDHGEKVAGLSSSTPSDFKQAYSYLQEEEQVERNEETMARIHEILKSGNKPAIYEAALDFGFIPKENAKSDEELEMGGGGDDSDPPQQDNPNNVFDTILQQKNPLSAAMNLPDLMQTQNDTPLIEKMGDFSNLAETSKQRETNAIKQQEFGNNFVPDTKNLQKLGKEFNQKKQQSETMQQQQRVEMLQAPPQDVLEQQSNLHNPVKQKAEEAVKSALTEVNSLAYDVQADNMTLPVDQGFVQAKEDYNPMLAINLHNATQDMEIHDKSGNIPVTPVTNEIINQPSAFNGKEYEVAGNQVDNLVLNNNTGQEIPVKIAAHIQRKIDSALANPKIIEITKKALQGEPKSKKAFDSMSPAIRDALIAKVTNKEEYTTVEPGEQSGRNVKGAEFTEEHESKSDQSLPENEKALDNNPEKEVTVTKESDSKFEIEEAKYSTKEELENGNTHATEQMAERDEQGDDQDKLGESVSGKGRGGSITEGIRQIDQEGIQPRSSASVSGSRADSGREASNSGVQAKTTDDQSGSAGNTELSGSVRDSLEGESILEAGRGTRTDGASPKRRVDETTERKIKDQQAANARTATFKAGDLKNVQETLPSLFPEQQDDVFVAEKRLFAQQETGMLFTNGTGTGKTFTGLGIIKRFIMQGKDNILVMAPNDEIIKAWIDSAKILGIDTHKLKDTKDAGKGVTISTYANIGSNDALVNRDWDLIVTDESQKLMEGEKAEPTNALDKVRALTYHDRGFKQRFRQLHANEYAKLEALQQEKQAILQDRKNPLNNVEVLSSLDKAVKEIEEERTKIYEHLAPLEKEAREEWSKIPKEEKPKVVFLSATPFAYAQDVDYAEGYLFEYDKSKDDSGYNQPDGRADFMMKNFGYRMRYGKLTRPDAEVNSTAMEMQFHDQLKKSGALSGRMLSTDKDYDRGFLLTDNALGKKIDEGLTWLRESKKYSDLYTVLMKDFDYLKRNYLLEAMKAKSAVEYVKQYLDQGKKVVVFHGYKKGGGRNPFLLETLPADERVAALYREFLKERPDLASLSLKDIESPIKTFKKAFGDDLLLFNGDESKKDRKNAVEFFNDDDSGKNVILVQTDAGQAGISLHDTTGKHQRVLINLGMPTKPTAAIQTEGRIYRVGQKSNAIFRYLNTGTNFEAHTFANVISERASTAENLALGSQARDLKQAFVDSFETTLTDEWKGYLPGSEQEGIGGKEKDRSSHEALSDFQRARSFYYGNQKKNSKSKSAEGIDYYATPEPIGLKMVEWANLQGGESVLEPSCGHGAISRWLPANTKNVMIEPSRELSVRAKMISDGSVIDQHFEDYYVGNKFDAVVMNPPFGKGGKTAMDHVAKAFKHLRDKGRIVALVPDGSSMEKHFEKWLESKEADGASIVATIQLPTSTFERAGTKVGTKILIIDKNGYSSTQRDLDLRNSKDINDLFDRVETISMPERESVDAAPKENPVVVDEVSNDHLVTGEHINTKTNETQYKATLRYNVDRETYKQISSIAKKNAGYWSKFAKSFLFDEDGKRNAFVQEASEVLSKNAQEDDVKFSIGKESSLTWEGIEERDRELRKKGYTTSERIDIMVDELVGDRDGFEDHVPGYARDSKGFSNEKIINLKENLENALTRGITPETIKKQLFMNYNQRKNEGDTIREIVKQCAHRKGVLYYAERTLREIQENGSGGNINVTTERSNARGMGSSIGGFIVGSPSWHREHKRGVLTPNKPKYSIGINDLEQRNEELKRKGYNKGERVNILVDEIQAEKEDSDSHIPGYARRKQFTEEKISILHKQLQQQIDKGIDPNTIEKQLKMRYDELTRNDRNISIEKIVDEAAQCKGVMYYARKYFVEKLGFVDAGSTNRSSDRTEGRGVLSSGHNDFLIGSSSWRREHKPGVLTPNKPKYSTNLNNIKSKTAAEWTESIKKAFPSAESITREGDTFSISLPNGNKMEVSINASIRFTAEDRRKAEKALGRKLRHGEKPNGAFYLTSDLDGIISLADNATDLTLNHEAFHAAKATALTSKEQSLLDRYFKDDEEAQADAYAGWKLDRDHAYEGTFLRRVFQKIYDFVNRMKAMLGIENKDNIFRKIADGEVWDRAVKTEESSGIRTLYDLDDAERAEIEADCRKFAEQLDEWKSGKLPVWKMIEVSKHTPNILTQLGAKNLPIVISQKVTNKIVNPPDVKGGKHDISIDLLAKLPHQLHDPVMIFESKTVPGNKVVLTELEDKLNRPVIVAIYLSGENGKEMVANHIASVYGRNNGDKFILEQIKEGNVLYINKNKSQRLFLRRGLQLPRGGFQDIDSFFNSILSDEKKDVKKPDVMDLKYSLGTGLQDFMSQLGGNKTDARIEIRQKENKKNQIGLIGSTIRSVHNIDRPVVKMLFDLSTEATEKQEKLRNHFAKEMKKVYKMIKTEEDQDSYQGILWNGDGESREYSSAELRDEGYSENVIKAYRKTRALLNYAYKVVDEARRNVRIRSKVMNKTEVQDLQDNKFAEIIKITELDGGNYLAQWRAPWTWENKEPVLISAEEYELNKQDEAIQILSAREKEDGQYEVRMRQSLPHVNKLEGYVPHFFHEYFVLDAETKKPVGSGRTINEAVKKAEQLLKDNENANYIIQPKLFNFGSEKEQYDQATVIGDKDYTKMIDKLTNDAQMSVEEAKEMMNGKVKTKARHRFLGSTMQRKGAEGYEETIDWVLAHHFNSVSRYAALEGFKPQAISLFERTFGAFDKEWTGDAGYLKTFINNVNGNPTAVEEMWNDALNQWMSKVPLFGKFFDKNNYGDRAALHAINRVNSIVAQAKLGFLNVSAGLMNLTQLAGLYGMLNEAAVLNGIKRFSKLSFGDKKILLESGVIDNLSLDSNGYSATRSSNSKGAAVWNGLKNIHMAPFEKSEATVRKITILAAYHEGIKRNMTHQAAINYAKEINRDVNFDYSVGDASGFFRGGGPLRKIALMFQKYPVKELELMHKIMTTKGLIGNARFWGTYLLMGGIFGLPFWGFINGILKFFTSRLGWHDPETAAKKALFEFAGDNPYKKAIVKTAVYGLFSNLGIDISKRAGMADVIEPDKSVASLLLGATGSTITGVTGKALQGDLVGAVRAYSPALGNYLQAATGVSKDSRGRMQYEYSDTERLIKGIGFRNVRESINSDVQRIKSLDSKNRQTEEKRAIDKFIDDPSSKNRKLLVELGISSKRVKQERKKKQKDRSERFMESLSKKDRKAEKALLDFAK